MLKKAWLYLFLLFASLGFAQENSDSLKVEKSEKESVVKVRKPKSPVLASTLSAIVPGAGQIYNGRHGYWKAPIIWGGFVTAYLMHDFYYDKYNFYNQIARYVDGGGTAKGVEEYVDKYGSRFTNAPGSEVATYSLNELKTLNSEALRRTQQIYLYSTLFYIIQIVDASVDAHFSNYDISDDLSVSVKPTLLPSISGPVNGVGLSFNF